MISIYNKEQALRICDDIRCYQNFTYNSILQWGRFPSPYNKEHCSRKVTKWHPWWHLKFKKRCCCLCMVTSHLIWTCIRVSCLSKAICKKCLKLAGWSRYLTTLMYRRLKTQYKSKFWSNRYLGFLIEKIDLICKIICFLFWSSVCQSENTSTMWKFKKNTFFLGGGGRG